MRETTYTLTAGLGFKLALVTDLHNFPGDEVLKSIERNKPDLIAIAGDLVLLERPQMEGDSLDQPVLTTHRNVLPFLQGCVSAAPTFVSLGNHEALLEKDDLEMIRETGAVLLDNCYVKNQGKSSVKAKKEIWIGGQTAGLVTNYRAFRKRYNEEHGTHERFPFRERRLIPDQPDADTAWLDDFEREEGYKILLCHHPEYWKLREPYLAERKIDLVLSGHAHGGQIRLFGRGLFAPGQGVLPRYTRGMFREKESTLIISAGLSNTVHRAPRLFNPTEMVYVEL